MPFNGSHSSKSLSNHLTRPALAWGFVGSRTSKSFTQHQSKLPTSTCSARQCDAAKTAAGVSVRVPMGTHTLTDGVCIENYVLRELRVVVTYTIKIGT
jgi:hypothetical protein